MSSSKNRRIKERRKARKKNQTLKDNAIESRKQAIEQKKKVFRINHALGSDKKQKKDNQGLVEKFKRLFKLKI